MNLKGKKILFVAVRFFDYEKAIAKRLSELGAEVFFYDDRPSNSVISKGIIRFNPKIIQKKIDSYYQHILKEIKNHQFDYFLLIKGEAIPEFFLKEIRFRNPKMQSIGYTYDSVQEHPRFLKMFPYFDSIFTFDRKDAAKFQMQFRPLFFVADYQCTPMQQSGENYDILFIGTAHTDRYLISENVRKQAEKSSLKTYFYYYSQSKSTFWLKKIFDKNFKEFNFRKLSFRKLNHSQILELYAKSKAVLDINKPYQNGLTIRTFEALASGKKLLTTNSEIIHYPFFKPENIEILKRESIRLNSNFFLTDFVKIDEEILKKMTLDSWIECLFFENQDNYWRKFFKD